MGVIYSRVDGRMIHGQVAAVWTTNLNIDEIIVINTATAEDDDLISLLEMATPGHCEVDVLDTRLGAKVLDTKDFRGDRTMVIYKTIQDVVDVVNCGFKPSTIHLGGVYKSEGKEKLRNALYLDASDIDSLRYLMDMGIELIYQVSPQDSKEQLKDILKEK